MKKRYFLADLQTFLIAASALFAVSCADNDLQDDSDNGDKSTMVRFDINEDNEVVSARQNPFSRTWKSHTNLTHPGKYFRPSKVKIMRSTSPK